MASVNLIPFPASANNDDNNRNGDIYNILFHFLLTETKIDKAPFRVKGKLKYISYC